MAPQLLDPVFCPHKARAMRPQPASTGPAVDAFWPAKKAAAGRAFSSIFQFVQMPSSVRTPFFFRLLEFFLSHTNWKVSPAVTGWPSLGLTCLCHELDAGPPCLAFGGAQRNQNPAWTIEGRLRRHGTELSEQTGQTLRRHGGSLWALPSFHSWHYIEFAVPAANISTSTDCLDRVLPGKSATSFLFILLDFLPFLCPPYRNLACRVPHLFAISLRSNLLCPHHTPMRYCLFFHRSSLDLSAIRAVWPSLVFASRNFRKPTENHSPC